MAREIPGEGSQWKEKVEGDGRQTMCTTHDMNRTGGRGGRKTQKDKKGHRTEETSRGRNNTIQGRQRRNTETRTTGRVELMLEDIQKH